MCTNPAQSLPAANRYRSAMEKCFLAVAEVVEDSETAKLADVLLPAALWVEKEGVYGQGERRYQLVEKLLEPPGQCRSDLQILVDLADRLGHGQLIKARTPEQVWDEYRQFSASSYYNFAGMTRERLRQEHGLLWPCPTEDTSRHAAPLRRGDRSVRRGRHRHGVLRQPGQEGGRLPAALRSEPGAAVAGVPAAPDHRPRPGAVAHRHHDRPHRRAGENQRPGDDRAERAGRLGVEDRRGDTVEVTSKFGAVRGTASVTGGPRRGVVFASFWDVRLLINQVVADHVDAASKEPEYKVTAVRVRKVEA